MAPWIRRFLVVLVLLPAVMVVGACGGDDDDDDGGGDVSVAELSSSLPTARDLGLEESQQADWDDATELLNEGLVIGGTTDTRALGAELEDAGFESAAGSDFGRGNLNVRTRAIQFDS